MIPTALAALALRASILALLRIELRLKAILLVSFPAVITALVSAHREFTMRVINPVVAFAASVEL